MSFPNFKLDPTPSARLSRARLSLKGLALGDSFGQTFFSPEIWNEDPLTALASAPWFWTDDTAMALGIYEILEKHGEILQDELASAFATRYIHDRNRSYGAAMHSLLLKISEGSGWRAESGTLFEGQGSWGNGSAMRVAPLGAYFADDLNLVASQAALSAQVTHAHEEGIAGAVALALGAAWAARIAAGEPNPGSSELLARMAKATPDSITRNGIQRAARLADGCTVRLAAPALGNGQALSCQDTVPLALWCATQHLDNYEKALRLTASAGGDVDTTCAMVGGIVILAADNASVPSEWLKRSEALPQWVFVEMKDNTDWPSRNDE